jgi:micrococcal nuclease
MWEYKGKVVRVVDGDTFDIVVDLGFFIFHQIRVRLRGVDTPEVYGADASPEGRAVSELVKKLIEGKDVTITTYKPIATTFNRYEADVRYVDNTGASIQLSEELVKRGYAKLDSRRST